VKHPKRPHAGWKLQALQARRPTGLARRAAAPVVTLFPAIPRWPGGLPPIPSRADVSKVVCSFQGQVIRTRQFGDVHWWDPMMADITDPADRADIYPQLRAPQPQPDGTVLVNTHINLSLDMTGLACLPKIKALIYEALTVGQMTGVLLMCMGDGDTGSNPGALGGQWLYENFRPS